MRQFTEEGAPHQVALESYGCVLRVCSNSPELLASAEAFFPPGWRGVVPTPDQGRVGIMEEPDETYSVYRGTTCVSMGQGLELSLVVLDGQIRGHVALHSPEMTFVHAGVVAQDGKAIVLPGQSFSGKTTLTAALVEAGATYYSDEFGVFDPKGRVHPYAKPLSIRVHRERLQVEHPVESFNGVAGKEPLSVGLLVVTSFRPGAEWDPKPISSGEGALALLSNTVTVRSRPDAAMRAVTKSLENAIVLEGERGEADEVAERLLEAARAQG